jgi:hypothetical protein
VLAIAPGSSHPPRPLRAVCPNRTESKRRSSHVYINTAQIVGNLGKDAATSTTKGGKLWSCHSPRLLLSVTADSPPAQVDTSCLVPFQAPLMPVSSVLYWHKIRGALQLSFHVNRSKGGGSAGLSRMTTEEKFQALWQAKCNFFLSRESSPP